LQNVIGLDWCVEKTPKSVLIGKLFYAAPVCVIEQAVSARLADKIGFKSAKIMGL